MSFDRWMDKEDVVRIYNGIVFHSAIKKNEIMPFAATWMNLDVIILSKVSQRQLSYDITYMESKKKKWYKWTYLQNRNRLTDLEDKLTVAKGEEG